MLGLEGRTRGMRRAVVGYDDLLSGWQAALEAAETGLGLSVVTGRTPTELEAAGTLVDTSLRRAAADWDALGLAAPVQDLAERSYAALGGLVGGRVFGPQSANELQARRRRRRSSLVQRLEPGRAGLRAARRDRGRRRALPQPAC